MPLPLDNMLKHIPLLKKHKANIRSFPRMSKVEVDETYFLEERLTFFSKLSLPRR